MGTPTTNRRAFITSAVAAGVAASAATAESANRRPLDLEDPRDNLDAYIKARSDVSGADAPLWSTGQAWSYIPGQRSKLLFRTTGLAISRTVRDDGGYTWLNRECLYFQDPETGEVIDTWTNPFTEQEVQVFHIRNIHVNSRFDYGGGNRPALQTYMEHMGDVTFYSDLMFFGPSPLSMEDYPAYVGSPYYQGASVYNHHVRRDDLENLDLGAAPAIVSWISNRQWAPWMEMGSWAGGMVISTRGKKLTMVTDLPADILGYMEKNDPEYLRSPEEVTQDTTSFYEEFRKYVDDKRARQMEEKP
ncbi:MAG: DUF1838 domain-containing protein [Gammaproteobacteria bacterium]|nr:DUF1838 domain-containing protein [Chromatiales bacterium]MYE47838.1 DUF1838 domain-containing protein [Gammaproteobacteria bacterium]